MVRLAIAGVALLPVLLVWILAIGSIQNLVGCVLGRSMVGPTDEWTPIALLSLILLPALTLWVLSIRAEEKIEQWRENAKRTVSRDGDE